MTPEQRAANVKQRALDLGFHAVGVADLSPVPHAETLDHWLANGMSGTMAYMGRQAARRKNPVQILAGATRAIVLSKHYDANEPATPPRPEEGRVAKYARGVDYHAWLNPLLTALVSHVKRLGDATTIARAYVDAGPVPERELAQRGGIGWIGKNTMLIDPARGSYSYLASVLTNLDLALDLPFEADRCGTCRRCIDACPTAAIGPERTVDARRCISYVTIEFKGAPSPDIASRMGDWVFGCDVCQDVCPWNQHFASAVPGARPTDAALARVDLLGLATMHDEEFARRFGSTALTRAGATSVRRNARIAVENQKRPVTTP